MRNVRGTVQHPNQELALEHEFPWEFKDFDIDILCLLVSCLVHTQSIPLRWIKIAEDNIRILTSIPQIKQVPEDPVTFAWEFSTSTKAVEDIYRLCTGKYSSSNEFQFKNGIWCGPGPYGSPGSKELIETTYYHLWWRGRGFAADECKSRILSLYGFTPTLDMVTKALKEHPEQFQAAYAPLGG